MTIALLNWLYYDFFLANFGKTSNNPVGNLTKTCQIFWKMDKPYCISWCDFWWRVFHFGFNQFHATSLFLYPLKTLKKLRFPVFRGYRKRPGILTWHTGYVLARNFSENRYQQTVNRTAPKSNLHVFYVILYSSKRSKFIKDKTLMLVFSIQWLGWLILLGIKFLKFCRASPVKLGKILWVF